MAGESARLGAASRKRYGAIIAGLTALIAARLRALDHADADADAAAGSVVAELVGALALSRAVADKSQSDAILARSRESVVARLGLAARVDPNRD